MENTTHEVLSLQTIDEILKLPQIFESAYIKRKDDAYIGSFDHVKGRFHRIPIVSGWANYGKALREQGAIVAVKYKLPMVNTDVIPEELSDFVLEHEAVESALDINASDTQNQIAFEKVDQLGLTKAIRVSRPRWNHIFATVRQLRLAQKENKLDEMMQFADDLESRPENKSEAFGNKELRDAICSLLKSAI